MANEAADNPKTYYSMAAFATVLSYDSMATFLTIYFYWGVVSGFAEQYYGMAFALYAAGTMFSSPVLAKWSQKRNIREPLVLSIILNMIGNISYFFAGSPSTNNFTSFGANITLFLIGRFFAGLGAGGMSLTLTYLITTTEESERLNTMNKFRSLQFWGKFAGPLFATAFLYIPETNFGFVHLNSATYPALSTVVFELIILIPCILFTGNIHQSHTEEHKVPLLKDPIAKQMIFDSCKIFVIFGASLVALWLVFSQIMPIGVILFGIAGDSPDEIWKIYLPPIIGGVVSMILVKRLSSIPDSYILIASAVGLTISMFTFFQINDKESAIVFYIGGTCLFFFNGTLATAFRSIYSLIVGQSRHLNVMMSLLFVVGSIGQIIGPVLSSVIKVGSLEEIDGEPCTCSPEIWNYSCCVLQHLNIAVGLAVAILFISTAYTGILLFWIKLPSLERRVQELSINEEESHFGQHYHNSNQDRY